VPRALNLFRKKPLDERVLFAHELRVCLSGRRAGKPACTLLTWPVASEDDGRREGAEIHQLR